MHSVQTLTYKLSFLFISSILRSTVHQTPTISLLLNNVFRFIKMSLSSDLSVSSLSSEPTTIELNNTTEVINFFCKNNITRSALKDTFNLIGKKKSFYAIDKDIKAISKFEFVYYVKCDKCKDYKVFASETRKKICSGCLQELRPNETNFFVYIPIKQQIIDSVQNNFNNIIAYYESISANESDYIRDIHDCEIYKNIQSNVSDGSVKNIPLSFVINTDGVQVFNIGSDTLWPIQLTQNFLPPNMRYLNQNILLVGVYYGKSKDLPVHAYFKPLCEEFEEMQTGIDIKKISNFGFVPYVTHASLDSPAKSKIQCFTQHNGRMGCCVCYKESAPVLNKKNQKNTRRFLLTDEPLEYRCHDDTLKIMMAVGKVPIKGVKDISPFVGFKCFDLIKSFGLDWLHMILKGSFEKLASLYFSTDNNKANFYIGPKKKEILEKRIRDLKPTKEVCNIRPLSEINNYKAHEQRAFLLFFFPIILNGLLPKAYLDHFNLLSESTYILLKAQISNQELEQCEINLRQFVETFEALFGKENVTMNIHLLLHTVYIVRALGPLWCYSTFCFESNNGVLKRYVKGPRNVIKQVTKKYILSRSVSKPNLNDTQIQYVGAKQCIAVAGEHKDAIATIFHNLTKLFIYASIKIKNTHYTSTRYKNTKSIDYFVIFNDNSIGKTIYYFVFEKKMYLLVEVYTVCGAKIHLNEIETTQSFVIQQADQIKDKLIYISYKIGIQSKREFICRWPNKYEKS